jgi:hypothetical protein
MDRYPGHRPTRITIARRRNGTGPHPGDDALRHRLEPERRQTGREVLGVELGDAPFEFARRRIGMAAKFGGDAAGMHRSGTDTGRMPASQTAPSLSVGLAALLRGRGR